MKQQQLLLFLFLLMSSIYTASAQKLELVPPAEGKAVVYFVTPVKFIPTTSFQYFEKGNYIGTLVAPNYLRYECEPGKKLFWLKAHGQSTVLDFIEGELVAGEIYVIESWNNNNLWTVPASFHFLDPANEKQLARISTILSHRHGSPTSLPKKGWNQESLQTIITESIRSIHRQRQIRAKKNKLKKLESALYFSESVPSEKK